MSLTSDRVKSLRLQKNMSQSDLADKLGIGRSNMGHIENGRVEPTKESIVQLSDIFGVTTDYLLGRTDTPQFTAKNERDVQKTLNELKEGLKNENSLAYLKNDGEDIDEEDAAILAEALDFVVRQSKLIAKKKFTRKDYQKNDDNDLTK